jgi:DNA-binding transcriptional MerR regulator
MDDELITIGRFSRLSGVSVHALRHYDDVGLLEPAEVDADSGYRRYRAGQIQSARLIRALRWIDLPIEQIGQILAAEGDACPILARHRDRLERQRSLIDAQIRDVTRFLENGLVMPTVPTGCRPVQIVIAVDDISASVAFYQELLGKQQQAAQRTSHGDFPAFVFGEYGRDDFFLLWLLDDPERLDWPGRSNFGLLVPDLDAAHRRALAAGATEAMPPRESEGMPRNSAVRDLSGNWISLFQGRTGPRPVQIMIAVNDAKPSVAFYEAAFGLRSAVARRTKEADYPAFTFGENERDDFFLVWLLDDPGRLDWPGTSNFSFLVDDLGAVHQRALAAGATEVAAPHDTEGMPRNSRIRDPSGNWIGLAQG